MLKPTSTITYTGIIKKKPHKKNALLKKPKEAPFKKELLHVWING